MLFMPVAVSGEPILDSMMEFFHTQGASVRDHFTYQGIISIYVLEDYVDKTFQSLIQHYFTNGETNYKLGDFYHFKEYHGSQFFVYRCDFHVYK